MKKNHHSAIILTNIMIAMWFMIGGTSNFASQLFHHNKGDDENEYKYKKFGYLINYV